jgi:hypothetical protein
MSYQSASMQWAHELFSLTQLGDARRTKRLLTVAADLCEQAGASFYQASATDMARLEGAYRWVRNPAVDPEAVAEAGFFATAAQVQNVPWLLAVEDTTTLSYSHQAAEQLGDLGGPDQAQGRGFLVHSTLLLNGSTGMTLGLIEQHYWMREQAARGQRHQRRERDYLDKESFKWQRASELMRLRLGRELMNKVVSVCDRESDVYEYLSDKLEHHERFILRACWNRKVELAMDPERQNAAHLFSVLAQAKLVARTRVQVPQRGGRPAREAELELRTLRVRFQRPKHGIGRRGPARIGLNVVVAREVDPPAEVEPLEWILLTTEPIQTTEQVLKVLRGYRLRWRVEEFHKAWKSGAGVERARHQSAGNLQRAAVILAFVAVRLLQLREAVEQDPQASCELVFEPVQWRVLWAAVEKSKPPKQAPSLRWAYYALGRLARWTDSKRTGRIGWQTLWRGWRELQLRVEGYHAAILLSEAEM